MIIEDISKDEVVIREGKHKFFKKRHRVKLTFHNGRSYISFNPDEKCYEIKLSKNQPQDLWRSWELYHEVHHLDKYLLMPKWLMGDLFNLTQFDFPKINLDKVLEDILNNLNNQYSNLREDHRKKILDGFIDAYGILFEHIEKLGHPQHKAFLNVFEDFRIELHIQEEHNGLEGFSKIKMALDGIIRAFTHINEVLENLGLFPIGFILPFSMEELSKFYRLYDFQVIFLSDYSEKEVYQAYKHTLRRYLKNIPKQAFADRKRVKLELERINSILRELKTSSAWKSSVKSPFSFLRF